MERQGDGVSLKTCAFEYDYNEDTYVFVKRESSPVPFDFDDPNSIWQQIDDAEGYSNVTSSYKLDHFYNPQFSQNGSFFLYGYDYFSEKVNYWFATVGANGEEDFSYVFVDIDFDTGASEYNLVLATEDSRLLVEKHDSYHLTKSIVGKKGDKLEIDVSLGTPPGVDHDAEIYAGDAFFWNEYVYVETVDYSGVGGWENRPKKLYRSPATGGGFDFVCEYTARFARDHTASVKQRGPWRAIFEQIEGSYNYNYGVLNVETGAIKMFHHGTFGYRKDSFQCDGRYAYHLRENYWDGDFDKERGIVYIHDLSLQYDISEYSTSTIDLALPPWEVGSIVQAFDDNEVGLFFRVGDSEGLPFLYHATSSTHKMYFTGFSPPNAIGWPAGGVKPIPRFWTNLIGCTEKP